MPDDLQQYLTRVRQRVSGGPLCDLTFIEIFCGAGGLCAAVRKSGLTHSKGVDHKAVDGLLCPLITIDLATTSGQALLFRILGQPSVVALHLAPPCGTASAARSIPVPGRKAPQPLRSHTSPDGLEGLIGTSLKRVSVANCLYQLTADVITYAFEHGLLWLCENPNRSLFWATSPMKILQKIPHILTRAHHCMFGSQRRKHTLFAHGVPQLQKVGVLCDGNHAHLPWGLLPNGSFAAHAEVAYPPMLCRAMACAVREQLIIMGARGPVESLLLADLSVHKAAQVALSKQAGKKLPPLVPEFSSRVSLCGPPELMPKISPLKSPFPIPAAIHVSSSLHALPAGSKLLSSLPSRGDPKVVSQLRPNDPETPTLPKKDPPDEHALLEVSPSKVHQTFGIPWTPDQFVALACKAQHPKMLTNCLPEQLKQAITRRVKQGRTEVLRKWFLRAKELKDLGPDPCVHSSIAPLLQGKCMRLLRELIAASEYGDKSLPEDIGKGFDLLGQIPASNVLPKKASFASLTIEDVRTVAKENQASALAATAEACRSAERRRANSSGSLQPDDARGRAGLGERSHPTG